MIFNFFILAKKIRLITPTTSIDHLLEVIYC
jgi:hypothetical protein